jgi:hypothetical protein
MFTKFFFQRFSPAQQINYLRKKGTLIGNQVRNSCHFSLYMVKGFFVEVMFPSADQQTEPRRIQVFSNLESLTEYLNEEARAGWSKPTSVL